MLFDFDGTIVDSSPLHDRAYRRALRDFRPELEAGFVYDRVRGRETRAVFEDMGLTAEEAEAATETKRTAYRDAVAAGELGFMPGAAECLEELAALGVPLYLATSGSRGSVSAALAAMGIAERFLGVVTASEVAHGKPAPDLFLKVIADYALDAASCIVVEDAVSGVEAARAAGLQVIGVFEDEVAAIGDLFLTDLRDLPPLLREAS